MKTTLTDYEKEDLELPRWFRGAKTYHWVLENGRLSLKRGPRPKSDAKTD